MKKEYNVGSDSANLSLIEANEQFEIDAKKSSKATEAGDWKEPPKEDTNPSLDM